MNVGTFLIILSLVLSIKLISHEGRKHGTETCIDTDAGSDNNMRQ